MHDDHTPTRSKSRPQRWVIAAVIVLLIGGCAFFAISYFRSNDALNKLQQAASPSSEKEAAALVRKISVHFTLPSEKPTIATIEDIKKLADQPFFKNAQNGDKVLMFTKSKKAVIYRPSRDVVIEVAYLNVKDGGN